jgi:hypothetical protein
MKTGDKVLISPDLTKFSDWTEGKVIEIENNTFVGIVISAETEDGNVFCNQSLTQIIRRNRRLRITH